MGVRVPPRARRAQARSRLRPSGSGPSRTRTRPPGRRRPRASRSSRPRRRPRAPTATRRTCRWPDSHPRPRRRADPSCGCPRAPPRASPASSGAADGPGSSGPLPRASPASPPARPPSGAPFPSPARPVRVRVSGAAGGAHRMCSFPQVMGAETVPAGGDKSPSACPSPRGCQWVGRRRAGAKWVGRRRAGLASQKGGRRVSFTLHAAPLSFRSVAMTPFPGRAGAAAHPKVTRRPPFSAPPTPPGREGGASPCGW